MKKAINLESLLKAGNTAEVQGILQEKLPEVFARINPTMRLSIKSLSESKARGNRKGAAEGEIILRVYIEGEQAAAANFPNLARQALQKAISSLLGSEAGAKAPKSGATGLISIKEMENGDEDEGVVLPVAAT